VTEFVTADDIKFNDGPCSEQAARVASDIQNQADPSVNWSTVYAQDMQQQAECKTKGGMT